MVVRTASPTRALGLVMCTALVVGNTIGMGIFMLPASLSPYGLNAIPAWLITAAGSIFIAWVFAGLARSFPDDDGPIAYAGRAFGGGVAFTLMWCYWVSTWVTNAVLATGVVGYLSMFFPVLGVNHWFAAVTALSLLWLFVLINLRGVRTAGGVQVLSSVLKLLPLVGIMALGLWVLFTPHARPLVHVPSTPVSLPGVIAASTLALYAMLGVESAALPAGRVRDPGRTIPRATFIGTLLVALISFCVSLVPILLIPQAELSVSNAPFADVFARLLGSASGKVLAAFVIVSGLGCLNGWTLDPRGDHGELCAPRRLSAGTRQGELTRGADARLRGHRPVCQPHDDHQLQRFDGGRLHLPQCRGHRRQPAAVSRLCAGGAGAVAAGKNSAARRA